MLETELKCMLSEDTYNILKTAFEWDWVKTQTNSYYSDTSGELKKRGITLRVRAKDGVNKVQIKKHKNSGSPLQISEESEFDIESRPASFSEAEVERMTGAYVAAQLLGSLTTLRHSLIYCDGVEICLDKNDYLDTTDYEIELEYTQKIPKELIQQLHRAGVDFIFPAVGKYSRFMARLAEITKCFSR